MLFIIVIESWLDVREEEQAFVNAIDTEYSYNFAKSMEQFRTNDALGYRTAGSQAEWDTGEYIYREMKALGMQHVSMDEICVDSWEFRHAIMRVTDKNGNLHEFQLGAYQTQFKTDGFETFELVDVGKGRERDYKGLDVTGKLVLARMNQREEWWINFPVYQAYRKGAAAFIAVQAGGFGEIDGSALNAQDIGGPAKAPAFSISREDAAVLEELLEEDTAVRVEFSADTAVKKNGKSYNITGEIPGKYEDRVILFSAHYDSYFSGFQDDNAAIGMMLGIGRAFLTSGYRPENTLRFCALAAEEWGLSDSKYDWSAGAFKQVFEVHPEWQGKIIADINFELPAHAHGEKDAVRCVTEYAEFIRNFVKKVKPETSVYPKGLTVRYPIQTMSDDFSMAIAGIPSMVNEFTSGQFMETHYHSQFDNEEYYEEPVYRFHHELYGRLAMAFDRTVLPPFDFGTLFEQIQRSLDLEFSETSGADGNRLYKEVEQALEAGEELYGHICRINKKYGTYLSKGKPDMAQTMKECSENAFGILMSCFRKAQDSFVRLNWHDEVLFPQEASRENLDHISQAIRCLEAGDIREALGAIYQIDNNRYAFMFDEEVFHHFTDYIMEQEPGRLQWGEGRIIHHENLYPLVARLKEKLREENTTIAEESAILKRVKENQRRCYCDDVEYMIHATEKIIKNIKELNEELRYGK